ncbi:GroES-like zinc-binding alcohol dehydrogenase family protein [Perilla frutescens var. hirtella]|uniref:GroES-like zinc-binding alcohol dehydrogenase family protein n=1 Tax=Perilla frutescens var. hirtella TaxID=608512 RepID=A0AAD4JM84_PERFH|nr:GroES-like zinc-binding alcohol dehydrogenase family protein [Perilla frutescens var. hirtella]
MGSHGEEENMAAWLLGVNNLKILPFKLPPLGLLSLSLSLSLSALVDLSTPSPHDARIRMKAVGICGSDVHYLKEMKLADFVVKEPMVIGHECAGIIEEVGAEVKHLVPGDRVAIEPGISCWRCNLCKDGRYNLCPEMKFFATPPYHGSLADQIVHPADLCFKLPDNVSLEEGAMCEPLSVGVHACRRANVGPETNVLVMGAGPIGLVTLLAARAFGSPRIVIVDVDDHRLSVAKKLGADETVKVSTNVNDVGAEVKRIKAAMGATVDITLDCAGFSKTMSTALGATSSGGKVCLVGMGHSEMTVPLAPAAVREVDVVGIFRYKNTWPLCIEFLQSGKIDVKPLITHRFGFSQKEIEDAFEISARGGTAIKVMFNL